MRFGSTHSERDLEKLERIRETKEMFKSKKNIPDIKGSELWGSE